MSAVSPCRECGAAVLWAKSESTGRQMPLDHLPVEDGNIVLIPLVHEPNPVARIVKPDEELGRQRYKSHFATCPKAGSFRKRTQRRKERVVARPVAPPQIVVPELELLAELEPEPADPKAAALAAANALRTQHHWT